MPLFVPILRLLMLFLNIYDSYKTLKAPPPSSRNAGRPSIRALTQRKRDMKGCLAVWIVSLSMYERMLEGIVCLLIPFYDEFKAMALFFLILTRARGAEPIYLHLIRPLIKPYTGTLDAILELMLMIGDFMFAVSMAPIHLGMEWWQQRFNNKYDGFETIQDSTTSSDSSNDVDISDLPTSFVASSAANRTTTTSPGKDQDLSPSRKSTAETTTQKTTTDTPSPSRKSTKEKIPADAQSRRPSGSASLRGKAPDNANLEPNFFESSRRRSGSPTRKSSSSSDGRQHQIWYPPRNSSSDEGFLQTTLAQQQRQLDEWREYPPFPSAYPPTPIAVTSRLVAASVSTFPPIEEDAPHQDFRLSLLPPREPLNPSPAVDLSDIMTTISGNSPSMDHVEDSVSTSDDYEDEDEFNMTLRTPLPAMGSLRSQIQPRRIVSIISASSAASVPSRASALTTSDNGSPLRTTGGASDSSLSSRPVESASIIGKKRSYPRNDSQIVVNRVRHIEDVESRETSEDDQLPVIQPLKFQNKKKSKSPIPRHTVATSSSEGPNENNDPMPSSAEDAANGEARQAAPPEEKRRKVVRSTTARPVVNPVVRPARTRVTKPSTSKIPKGKFLEVPTVPKRPHTRLHPPAAASTSQRQESDGTLSGSSVSTGDEPRPQVNQKVGSRNVARKKI